MLDRNDRIICPKCSYEQEKDRECRRCGLIFEKYQDGSSQTIKPVTPLEDNGLKAQKDRDNTGRVVIEIFIVGVCIVIWASIVLYHILFPPPLNRGRANSAAQGDLRNVATAQEAYYVDHQTYTGTKSNLVGTYGFRPTKNVVLSIAGSATGYTITAYHTSGFATYTISGPGGSISQTNKH
jgi:Tfp pilus assembly protein PilE